MPSDAADHDDVSAASKNQCCSNAHTAQPSTRTASAGRMCARTLCESSRCRLPVPVAAAVHSQVRRPATPASSNHGRAHARQTFRCTRAAERTASA
eukprot:4822179-Prymnesium_polylepis.1